MREIDPANLRDYIDRKIYKYDTFCVEEIELDAIHGYVEFNDTVVVRINNKDTLVDLHLAEIILFETLEDAKTKQVLDIYNLYKGRYKIPDGHTSGAVEYYKRFIDESDFEFFLLTATNYQMREEEFLKIITQIFEKHPEYLI